MARKYTLEKLLTCYWLPKTITKLSCWLAV